MNLDEQSNISWGSYTTWIKIVLKRPAKIAQLPNLEKI